MTLRCTEPGCPVRYRGGPDRPCPIHQQEHTASDWAERMDEFGVQMAAAPGFPTADSDSGRGGPGQ